MLILVFFRRYLGYGNNKPDEHREDTFKMCKRIKINMEEIYIQGFPYC